MVDILSSVWDSEPHVFGPPGSGFIRQRYGSRSFLPDTVMLEKLKFLTKNFSKKLSFKTEDNVPADKL